MSEYLQKSKDDVIQRKKDRRNMLWRSEDEEKEKETIQKKSSLEIGASDDIYEQEADAVAAKVVEGYGVNNSFSNATPKIQSKFEEGTLMAKSEDGGLNATAQLESSLNSSKGGGEALTGNIRSEMESKMGADLSDVKIHTDSSANSMSEGINAKAFTHGQDVYFNQGNYNASTTEGKGLLAHELAHTQQQKNGLQRKIQRAMKFEFQTYNYVWKVSKEGDNPELLDRKYSPSGESEERGSEVAYLSTGLEGVPAIKEGDYIKATDGPRTMKPVDKEFDSSKLAQYVVPVIVTNLYGYVNSGDTVAKEDIRYMSPMSRIQVFAKNKQLPGSVVSPDMVNPETYEFKYYDRDQLFKPTATGNATLHWDQEKQVPTNSIEFMKEFEEIQNPTTSWLNDMSYEDVHMDSMGSLKKPHVKWMSKVNPELNDKWVEATKEIKNGLPPQYEWRYNITGITKKEDLIGKHISEVEMTLDKPSMKDNGVGKKDEEYNKDTYKFSYFLEDNTEMKVHLDWRSVFQDGEGAMVEEVSKWRPYLWAKTEDIAEANHNLPAQTERSYTVTGKQGELINSATDLSEKQASDFTIKEIVGSSVDNSVTLGKGKYNPETFDLKYYNANNDFLRVHIDQYGVFQYGEVKLMKVGRQDRKSVDKMKEAQYQQIIVVKGILQEGQILGKILEESKLEKGVMAKRDGDGFNPDTYEFIYMTESGKQLKVHRDTAGRFQFKHIKFMQIATAKDAQEGSAVELQSETDGVLEFETPQWFRKWSELRARIQEAVDMTDAISASRELVMSNAADAKILNAMGLAKETTYDSSNRITGTKKGTGKIGASGRSVNTGGGSGINAIYKEPRRGRVVEWPAKYSTSHLTSLEGGRLIIEIVDPTWKAAIQSSESVTLSQYANLLAEHETAGIVTKATDATTNIISKVQTDFDALMVADREDLRGFIQMVSYTIYRGQHANLVGEVSKAAFTLNSRNSFYSMYHNLLSPAAQLIFSKLVTDHTILKEFKLDTGSFVFPSGYGAHTHAQGPTVQAWLESIIVGIQDPYASKEQYRKGRLTDRISPTDSGSGSMGAMDAEGKWGKKDSKLVKFEIRGTSRTFTDPSITQHPYHSSIRVQPAVNWVAYAEELFKHAAETRPRPDIMDDPSTEENEATQTGLIYDPPVDTR